MVANYCYEHSIQKRKSFIQWNWDWALSTMPLMASEFTGWIKVGVHVDGLGCCCCCCSPHHYRLASVCLYFVLFVYVIVEWKDSERPTTKTMPMTTTTHSLGESTEIIFILAKSALHRCNQKKRSNTVKRMQCLNNLNSARSFGYLLASSCTRLISIQWFSFIFISWWVACCCWKTTFIHSPKRIGHGVKHGILPIPHQHITLW